MSGKPTVHPRIRGERRFGKSARAEEIGSSPHARGTRYRASARQLSQRFIPACAGNASPCQVPTMIGAVHPRIRGERTWGMITPSGLAGSSPHTRGTRDGKTCGDDDFRFIPAYAGNASGRARRASTGTVHPRIRGERDPYPFVTAANFGSSPHTRGTRLDDIPGIGSRRFIPAYAGNAPSRPGLKSSATVHPRIRGERSRPFFLADVIHGSSPHTRGTRVEHASEREHARFIPAYAGNADQNGAGGWRPTVHPRIRGERLSETMAARSAAGSSPHTRGTRARSGHVQHGRRFIPAYAGNARREDLWR